MSCVLNYRPHPHGTIILSRHSHHFSRADSLTNLTSAKLLPSVTLCIVRVPGLLPFVAVDERSRSDGTLLERPPSANDSGPKFRQGHDVVSVPHPIPHEERRSECDRQIEGLKHLYENLSRGKDAQIEGLRRGILKSRISRERCGLKR